MKTMLDVKSFIFVCFLCIGAILCDDIETKFKKHQVVPDILRKSPTAMLYVKYKNGVEPKFGNELTPAETVEKPGVAWEADSNSFYTLVMVDVDAYLDRIHLSNVSLILWTPSRRAEDVAPWSIEHPDAPSRKNPIRRNWLHWLVVNVPGKSVAKGITLAAYNGPAPPKDTGAHRYVLLVYKQGARMEFAEQYPDSEKGRRGNFNLRSFTTKYHLGDPIAGNFFQASPQN